MEDVFFPAGAQETLLFHTSSLTHQCPECLTGCGGELLGADPSAGTGKLQILPLQGSVFSLQENESNPPLAGTTLLRCVCLGSGGEDLNPRPWKGQDLAAAVAGAVCDSGKCQLLSRT